MVIKTAKKMFKVCATKTYYSDRYDVISFKRGQAFYVLGVDLEMNCYFVSTECETPFSATALSGYVPVRYFCEIIGSDSCEDLYVHDMPDVCMHCRYHKQVSQGTMTE